MTTQRYRTPDGTLELLVIREDGDISVGFDGFTWHTHGDVLVGEYALLGEVADTPEQALERFLHDLQSDDATIVIYRKGSTVQDVCVSLSEPEDDKYMGPDESRELRSWSK
jgi:hypothetical protein